MPWPAVFLFCTDIDTRCSCMWICRLPCFSFFSRLYSRYVQVDILPIQYFLVVLSCPNSERNSGVSTDWNHEVLTVGKINHKPIEINLPSVRGVFLRHGSLITKQNFVQVVMADHGAVWQLHDNLHWKSGILDGKNKNECYRASAMWCPFISMNSFRYGFAPWNTVLCKQNMIFQVYLSSRTKYSYRTLPETPMSKY